MTPLKQMSFENIVTKRRNCSKQAISPFATIFSTLFNSEISFMEIFHFLVYRFSRSSAADLLYVGKGLNIAVSRQD